MATTMLSPAVAAMVSPQRIISAIQRRAVRIMATLMLAALVFAGVMYAQRRHDNTLSTEFRSSGQQAFRAISGCETLRLYPPGGLYEAREMDAEKAVSAATATARTQADRLAATTLTDYLHHVKIVRLAWENRDRKSVQRDYMQYSHDLRTAKQKAQSALGVS